MESQKRQRQRPRLGGGGGVVRCARVAEEGMIRIRNFDIDEVFAGLAERVADGSDLILGEVLILAAPKKEHRATEVFRAVEQAGVAAPRGDTPSIVGSRASDGQSQAGKERRAATHAIADGA